MAVAGTAALPQLYPFPPGSFDVPVTQDDAYRGDRPRENALYFGALPPGITKEGLVKSIQGWWDEQRANGVICEPLCEVTILDGPNSYDPELMVCWARVAFPTLAHADLALGMDGICLLPYLNEVPPMSKGRILVQRYPNPDMMSYPNRMATMFQSIFNCLPNLCFRTPFWCMTFCAQCNYPSVAWMPATSYVAGVDEGQRAASLQSLLPDNFGGVWVFPTGHAGIWAYLDLFRRCGCCPASSMPTPPPPANSAYESLKTDVKPGEPGSKVTMWLHGSGYIITSTLDFLYTMGFMYSQSSQSTLLLVEYPMVPEWQFPTQLDRMTRTYAMLVKLYGRDNVIVGGDSAGGGLAMAMLINATSYVTDTATQARLDPPAATLLISPWADISNGQFFYRNPPWMENTAYQFNMCALCP